MGKCSFTASVPASPYVLIGQRATDRSVRGFARTLTLTADSPAEVLLDIHVLDGGGAREMVNMALAAAARGNWDEVFRLRDFAVLATGLDSVDAAAVAVFVTEILDIAWPKP